MKKIHTFPSKMAEPASKAVKLTTLGQLKEVTTVVADTGDFEGLYFN